MVLSLLFPVRCPGCGVAAEPICADCAAGLRPADPAPTPAELDWCVAPFAFEGLAADLIAGVKYRGARAAIPWLADAIVAVLPTGNGPPEPDPLAVDIVTWAPTGRARRRSRGVDHAAVLARAVGRRLRRPVRGLLRRWHGPPQTGRSRTDRLEVEFTARRAPARVLLVDDVTTTGATLSAAARALRAQGAAAVMAAVAGRTPGSQAPGLGIHPPGRPVRHHGSHGA